MSVQGEGCRERRVDLDGRAFFVKLDPAGRPLAIKERKVYEPGRPWESLYNASYWHHSHGICATGRGKRLGRKSIVADILTKAGVDTRQLAGH